MKGERERESWCRRRDWRSIPGGARKELFFIFILDPITGRITWKKGRRTPTGDRQTDKQWERQTDVIQGRGVIRSLCTPMRVHTMLQDGTEKRRRVMTEGSSCPFETDPRTWVRCVFFFVVFPIFKSVLPRWLKYSNFFQTGCRSGEIKAIATVCVVFYIQK